MGTRLFIAGLAWRTTEDGLVRHLAPAGEVTWLRFATDRDTSRHKGYAFVEMATPEQAEHAVALLDGSMLDDRPLTVQEAKPRPEPGPFRAPGGPRPEPVRPSRSHAVDPGAARTRRW